MGAYFDIGNYEMLLLAAGVIALLAALVPVLLRKRYASAPIIYLIVGALGCWISGASFSPLKNLALIEHITEFVVLVALVNAGLRIKEPFKWKTWRYSARLLAIAMPFTIAAAALLGWWILGLAPATALLYGAIISPTDPVLASELQTTEPGEEDTSKSRLGLTSEAGINDGLAFPFTYLAIRLANEGDDIGAWLGEWLLHDLFIKVLIGAAIGLATGWGLYKLVFNISSDKDLNKISRGILSLALILLPYTITEYVGGYGFIAVFFAACIFSDFEKHEEHMNSLHEFNRELEGFVMAVIFIATGVFLALHEQILYNWQVISVALALVLIVRPVAGYISLLGAKLNGFQKFVLSFYGIRGIGSVYYLAFALSAAGFEGPERLFAVTVATIFFSVLIHGVSARVVQKRMKKYDYTRN